MTVGAAEGTVGVAATGVTVATGASVAEGVDADGDVAYALNAGAAGCCTSLEGRATAAAPSVPVVMAVVRRAVSDFTCADALPIMIALQSAAITSDDVAGRVGK